MKILSRTKTGDPFLDLSIQKQHLRLVPGFVADDAIIQQYMNAATTWLEKVCDTVLIASDFVVTSEINDFDFTGYPGANITSVEYLDDLDVTVPVVDYSLKGGLLVVDLPDTAQSITLALSATPAGDLEPLAQAGYMIAAAFYEEPANLANYSVSQLPFGARQLIAPYRSFAH